MLTIRSIAWSSVVPIVHVHYIEEEAFQKQFFSLVMVAVLTSYSKEGTGRFVIVKLYDVVKRNYYCIIKDLFLCIAVISVVPPQQFRGF